MKKWYWLLLIPLWLADVITLVNLRTAVWARGKVIKAFREPLPVPSHRETKKTFQQVDWGLKRDT